MSRPDFVTDEDIARWDQAIKPDSDSGFSLLAIFPGMKEVVYAGQWFAEEMTKLGVPEEKIVELAFVGGRLSFHKDPWEAHQELLDIFKKSLENATTT